MASLEDFRERLDSGDIEEVFKEYKLDFNTDEFDRNGTNIQAYQTEIVWEYEEPNKIKMCTAGAESSAEEVKKITYLPWETKAVTSITLDGDSPPYFVTSHFSGCRFTMQFHDDQAKKVTVMHVAGDTHGNQKMEGSFERDKLEESAGLDKSLNTKRMSIAGYKNFGKRHVKFMEERRASGTLYYDSFARLFGVRGDDGSWSFYAQEMDHEKVITGLLEI